MIDDIFLSLGLDRCEWLEDIEREDSSLASFMSCTHTLIHSSILVHIHLLVGVNVV